MEKVIHNVGEIDIADRQAIERLIGKGLAEHQQIIISVVEPDPTRPREPAPQESEEELEADESLFEKDLDYVLDKNADLYWRLAQ